MVDPYGKLLGKITIPMDGMGNMIHNKLKPLCPTYKKWPVRTNSTKNMATFKGCSHDKF